MSTTHYSEVSLAQVLAFLNSDAAIESIESDPYWPKWDSPWWHVTLLNEMGLIKKVPERVIRKLIDQLNTHYLRIFPIHPGELPEGMSFQRQTLCHCAAGNIYQALAAWGVNVDHEIPWRRPWFLRYQMPDGGLNCDSDAYLHQPPASSMVGTIAPLEAVLFYTNRAFTPEEIKFLDRGAQCLLDRKLMHATTNPHNAEEILDEADWLKLCFSRFYLYDILRGLTFILQWSDKMNRPIPVEAIREVVNQMEKDFPDGNVRIGRHSYDEKNTILKSSSGEWVKQHPTHFKLLEEVGEIGQISPFLSGQWKRAKQTMAKLQLIL